MKLASLRGLIAVAAVGYVVFLLISFPAHVAVRLLPETVSVMGAQGTVWRGQAFRVSVGGVQLGSTQWKLQPLSLLTGRVAADVTAALTGGAIDGTVAVSPGAVRLSGVSGVIPIEALESLLPVSMIDGRIGLDIQSARIESGWLTDAEGTVDLVELRATAPTEERLGNFEIIFEGAGEEVLEGVFRDTKAPLKANGKLLLYPDKRWEIDGQVSATAETSRQLNQAFTMLGARDEKGIYTLAFSGQQ